MFTPFSADGWRSELRDGVLIVHATRAKLRDDDAIALTAHLLEADDVPLRVILDLGRAEFMSTAVLSALTRLATEFRLRVVGVSGTLDRLFGMLGVAGFFHRCDSIEVALSDLNDS